MKNLTKLKPVYYYLINGTRITLCESIGVHVDLIDEDYCEFLYHASDTNAERILVSTGTIDLGSKLKRGYTVQKVRDLMKAAGFLVPEKFGEIEEFKLQNVNRVHSKIRVRLPSTSNWSNTTAESLFFHIGKTAAQYNSAMKQAIKCADFMEVAVPEMSLKTLRAFSDRH